MVRCPSCGHENAADASFCGGCGSSLSAEAVCQEPREALRLYEEQARAYFGRLGGYFFLRFQRMRRASSDEPGEDVIMEFTPTKITAFNGSAAVNPVFLLAMRAVRFVGL